MSGVSVKHVLARETQITEGGKSLEKGFSASKQNRRLESGNTLELKEKVLSPREAIIDWFSTLFGVFQGIIEDIRLGLPLRLEPIYNEKLHDDIRIALENLGALNQIDFKKENTEGNLRKTEGVYKKFDKAVSEIETMVFGSFSEKIKLYLTEKNMKEIREMGIEKILYRKESGDLVKTIGRDINGLVVKIEDKDKKFTYKKIIFINAENPHEEVEIKIDDIEMSAELSADMKDMDDFSLEIKNNKETFYLEKESEDIIIRSGDNEYSVPISSPQSD